MGFEANVKARKKLFWLDHTSSPCSPGSAALLRLFSRLNCSLKLSMYNHIANIRELIAVKRSYLI